MSLPTLRAVAAQREWKGTPSTTMLLNGTRESYLKIIEEYPIKPKDMIWAIFGTGVHAALEQFSTEDDISEERIFGPYSSGSPDRYEKDTGFLYDYKTYGSYKTAKVLGLKKERIPIYDKDGVQLKYKNGKLKYFDKWNIGHKSRLDLSTQLNDYRIKIEQELGFPVKKMFAEILTRDGGTFTAKGRGIDENAQLVKINKISDIWINRYMKAKADALHWALESRETPPPCKYRETWGSLKCAKFCQVWEHCDVGQRLHETVS